MASKENAHGRRVEPQNNAKHHSRSAEAKAAKETGKQPSPTDKNGH